MARRPKTEREKILVELREIADNLDKVPGWYARRLELFKRGQALTDEPPILQRELAAASKITETAVNKELKRPPKAVTAP